MMNRRVTSWILGSVALSASFAISGAAVASLEQAPASFPHLKSEAVFVDFASASYRITYDVAKKEASVLTEMNFRMPSEGYPIFDLVPNPTNVLLDGVASSTTLVSDPDGASKLRVIDTVTTPGVHRVSMQHILEEGVSFKGEGVASAFWMSDLDDREYLEQYLPTNLEYDAIAMRIGIEIIGSKVPHTLYTNGNVENLGENRFEVIYPEFYTTSSMFFHLLPKGSVPSTEFTFKSIDGRELPVEIYTNNSLSSFVSETKSVLNELEADYGPFPHAKVVIYGAGAGGMEYSGATMTSVWALGHELFHSYNARAVMPAQGNAGWIDEAISSWRDERYELRDGPGATTEMAGHSKWTRRTDDAAYTRGEDFLAWIAGRMSAEGKSFKSFLREYFNKNYYTTVTTDFFRQEVERYSGLDLSRDFQKYIYGKGESVTGSTWKLGLRGSSKPANSFTPEQRRPNPYHPRLTREQRNALLWP